MNYQVSLKKLSKIANPFEEPLFGFLISKQSIDRVLYEGNVFFKPENSTYDNTISEIAYLVANYYPEEISIVVPENMENNNIVKSGLVTLAAAIYKNEANIVANIEGNAKAIKALLGVDLKKPDNVVLPKEELENFNWEINPELLSQTWGDPEFILNKINNAGFGDAKKLVIEEAVKFALPTIWDNEELVKKILEGRVSIDSFPSEMFMKNSFFNVIKDSSHSFEKAWNSQYQELYKLYEKNFSQPNKKLLPEEIILLDRIKNEVFGNPNMASRLMTVGHYCTDFYQYFPIEVKYSSEVLDTIYNSKKAKKSDSAIKIYETPETKIPEKFSKDYEWIKNFLVKYTDVLSLSDTSTLKKLASSWYDSKGKVLELINDVPYKEFYKFFKVLSPELQKDSEVVETFFNKFKEVYVALSAPQKKKYMKKYIDKGGDVDCIKMEDALALADREILLSLVKNGKYDWLKSVDTPNEYKTDADLILAAGSKIQWLIYDKKILSTLSKETETIIRAVEQTSDFYNYLPENKKTIPEVALAQLAHEDTHASSYKSISKALYSNKDFCLKAMKVSPTVGVNIPEQFWDKKDFLLSFFKAIDDSVISPEAIKHAPPRVKQLLDVFSITSNYEKFIINYILHNSLSNNLAEDNKIVKKKSKI